MNHLKAYINLVRFREVWPAKTGENHHIFPVSIFGQNGRTVKLTTREHFVAHKLIYHICLKRYGPDHYKTRKMLHAARMMLTMRTDRMSGRDLLHTNSRFFALIREHNKERWMGDLNPAKDPEVRAKISESKIGVERPDMKGKAYFGSGVDPAEIHKKITATKEAGIFKENLATIGKKTNYPANRKSREATPEIGSAISKGRQRTKEKFIAMSRDEFAEWFSKQRLYNDKGRLNSNVMTYIKARGETLEYYLDK